MHPITLLYTPFPTLESASSAAEALLAARLVACCNLLPGTVSHYVWQGAATQADEVLLIAKTSRARQAAACAELAAIHPYECPAILALSADTTADFAAWVAAQTE